MFLKVIEKLRKHCSKEIVEVSILQTDARKDSFSKWVKKHFVDWTEERSFYKPK